MTDISHTIVAKSSQQNADDYIGGSRTITVTKVELTESADQPVAIFFTGDEGKPYLPCKTCRRVMVRVWGPEASAYIGRSLTIYRDDRVTFGGLAVGGLRISHMSHIDKDVTLALQEKRGNKKPITVKPLKVAAEKAADTPRPAKAPTVDREPPPPLSDASIAEEDIIPLDEPAANLIEWAETIERHIDLAPDRASAIAIFTEAAKETEWAALKIDNPDRAASLRAKVTDFGKVK